MTTADRPLLILMVVLALPGLLAAQATPTGSEFQVNTYTTSQQMRASAAMAADGDFVVVWQSYGASAGDTAFASIQGQRYAADGTALGGQFQVNSYTTSTQYLPSVAMDADGDFIVVWQGGVSWSAGPGLDGSDAGISGQRYAADGTALGGEFQVNTYTTSAQVDASVAVDADGDFVVVWDSNGSSGTDTSNRSIQGQRYAADGTAQGGEFQVNTYTSNTQRLASAAMDTDGDFVVVWESDGGFGTDTWTSIQGQRYAADGSALGSQFQVNTYTTYWQRRPSVAMDDDGDFVVAWHTKGPEGSNYGIRGQRYAADGSALGGEFQVNTYTTDDQEYASVASDPGGNFVVVWHSDGSSGTDSSWHSVQGQQYAADGTPVGGEFQINTWTTHVQAEPTVAVDANGGFVVAWRSSYQVGTNLDVFAQRYEVQLDLGDAPDPTYPTLLASDGARHALSAGLYLGAGVDVDSDGQPNALATGDDIDADGDDEDGVTFTSHLVTGEQTTLDVTASAAGLLNAWIDYDDDGDWADPGEQIFSDQALAAGVNSLFFTVPAAAVPTNLTFARFRFSTGGGLSYDGPAADGEVEDYALEIHGVDFGDAPDPAYPTLLASDGARHVLSTGPFLGAAVDDEADGQPNGTATGDDIDADGDDEDGVAFTSLLVTGEQATLNVTGSGAGLLNAWIDYNDDGDWADAGEQVFTDQALAAGGNSLFFTVPAAAVPTSLTFARFRFDTTGGLSYDGLADDGEVEDYGLEITGIDFGDAPDPAYPTLLASNGARHTLSTGPSMGAAVDAEPDGQPNAGATGDDGDADGDDEDGVALPASLIEGQLAPVDITVSAAGLLNGWVDFNADGDWADGGEQVFTDQALAAGVNNLSFTVPMIAASTNQSFARFRVSTAGGLSYDGPAADGEVEDYAVVICPAQLHLYNETFTGTRTFEATQLITAELVTVAAGADVSLTAGQSIELANEVESEAGGDFTVALDSAADCRP